MKRIFTLIIFALLITAANGQSLASKIKSGVKNTIKLIDQDAHPTGIHTPWDLYVAPKIGLSVSNLTSTNCKLAFGVNAGAYIEVFILPNLAVDMELSYTHQGANDLPHSSPTAGYREYDFSLDYINTTYLCRWYPVKERPLSVYSGLHLARLFNAKGKVGGNKYDIYDDLHHGDLAIPIGASYEWKQWQADVRYNFFVKSIAASQDSKTFLDNARNNMLNVTVAYKIQLW